MRLNMALGLLMIALLPLSAQGQFDGLFGGGRQLVPGIGFNWTEERSGFVPKPPLTLSLDAIPPVITGADQQTGILSAASLDNVMLPTDTGTLQGRLITAGLAFRMEKIGGVGVLEGLLSELASEDFSAVQDYARAGALSSRDFRNRNEDAQGRYRRDVPRYWMTLVRGKYLPRIGDKEIAPNQSPVAVDFTITPPSTPGRRFYLILVPVEDRRENKMFPLINIVGKSSRYLPVVFSVLWTQAMGRPYTRWVEWAARTRGFDESMPPEWLYEVRAYQMNQMQRVQAQYNQPVGSSDRESALQTEINRLKEELEKTQQARDDAEKERKVREEQNRTNTAKGSARGNDEGSGIALVQSGAPSAGRLDQEALIVRCMRGITIDSRTDRKSYDRQGPVPLSGLIRIESFRHKPDLSRRVAPYGTKPRGDEIGYRRTDDGSVAYSSFAGKVGEALFTCHQGEEMWLRVQGALQNANGSWASWSKARIYYISPSGEVTWFNKPTGDDDQNLTTEKMTRGARGIVLPIAFTIVE